jgi:hypothetical protein
MIATLRAEVEITTLRAEVERLTMLNNALTEAAGRWAASKKGYLAKMVEQHEEAETLRATNERLKAAGQALIDDVRRRYPGKALFCQYMRALDAALTQEKQG